MKRTVRVGPSRYQPPAERPNWERIPDPKIGRAQLYPGRSVKIADQRGATFEYQYAERNIQTGEVVLAFVGGGYGRRMDRFFRLEQVTKVLKW